MPIHWSDEQQRIREESLWLEQYDWAFWVALWVLMVILGTVLGYHFAAWNWNF